MKYLTKDWLIADCLSCMDSCVRSSKNAEKTNDDYYIKQYRKKYKIYVTNEKNLPFYRSPRDILKQFDGIIDNPDISEPQREMWLQLKKSYERLYRKQIENDIFFKFEEDDAAKRFAEYMKQKSELCLHLPTYIKNEICDMRLFALGYASADVKRLLRPYCAQLRRQCAKTKKIAEEETEKAVDYLPVDIKLEDFADACLIAIKRKSDNLYLLFDSCDVLVIENAEITERESPNIYAYISDIPNCPCSRVIAAELHRIKRKFEIHFMIKNSKETNECEIWYLTIRGTNISKFILLEDNSLFDYTSDAPIR